MNKHELMIHLEPLKNAFLKAPWENKAFYEQYLAQTYYYTYHSTRMLAYAAAMTTSEQESYYKRCIKHISEEQGHDRVAANDLAKFAKKTENFSELPITKAVWQTQYYYISKNNTSLLGYILALEWLAVEAFENIFERVKKIYPLNATHFVRIHAEEDPSHVEECFVQMEQLSVQDKAVVTDNFIQTCEIFKLFIEGVEQAAAMGAQSLTGRTENREALL